MISLAPRPAAAPEILEILRKEKLEAIDHFENGKKAPKPQRKTAKGSQGGKGATKGKKREKDAEEEGFSFRAYRDRRVKEVLVEIFRGKCAYCEVQVKKVYPGDVEHYRPKGRIQDAALDGGKANYTKPGYYWLAADWENLLLSCQQCNAGETQKVPDPLKPEDRSAWVLRSTGKIDLFPLQNPKERAKRSDARLEREEPLLLNPCLAAHDPGLHLSFGFDGGVLPKGKGLVRDRAITSILVYRLGREALRNARAELAHRVGDLFVRLRDTKEALRENPKSARLQATLVNAFLQLDASFHPKAEHLAVARATVDPMALESFRKLARKAVDQLLKSDDALIYLNLLSEWEGWNELDRNDLREKFEGTRQAFLDRVGTSFRRRLQLRSDEPQRSMLQKVLSCSLRLEGGQSMTRALLELLRGSSCTLRLSPGGMELMRCQDARALWKAWLKDALPLDRG